MNAKDFYQIILPALVIIAGLFVYFLLKGGRQQKLDQRMARVTKRKIIAKKTDAQSLRKSKGAGLPVIGKLLQNMTSMEALRARLEKAGLAIAPDRYVAACAGIFLVSGFIMFMLHKPPVLTILTAFMFGVAVPHYVVGMKGKARIKKFLSLFPDAIDFIVRGLRSGLPATESMNMVGIEMEEPVGSIFAGIGESVRLGVSVEKALSETGRKLGTTEFNFFVTSIILQRETGGNLSEILSNLSDVLRKRFMMRMKIKAMSSEAKASAIIVGALPFVVILALTFVSPGYLDPLWDDSRGHVASAIAGLMMLSGIGIMVKMTKFEI